MTRSLCLVTAFSLAALGLPGCGAEGNNSAQKTTPAPTATKPSPPPAPATTRRLKRAEPLPKLARDLLTSRMLRHAKQMQKLLWAAVLLDYQAVAALAKQIADEPRIAKPSAADINAINHVFPKRFFALQDELLAEAQALAAAASSRNDTAMAVSYGKLSKTCVSCHALYLSFKLHKKQ